MLPDCVSGAPFGIPAASHLGNWIQYWHVPFFGVNGCPVLSSHGVDVDANVHATSRYHGELHDADSEIHHQAGIMDSSFLESN